MTKQIKHIRKSKRGKLFIAGKRNTYIMSCPKCKSSLVVPKKDFGKTKPPFANECPYCNRDVTFKTRAKQSFDVQGMGEAVLDPRGKHTAYFIRDESGEKLWTVTPDEDHGGDTILREAKVSMVNKQEKEPGIFYGYPLSCSHQMIPRLKGIQCTKCGVTMRGVMKGGKTKAKGEKCEECGGETEYKKVGSNDAREMWADVCKECGNEQY